MYRHIAISLWILFIVFYGSYALEDGIYALDEATVCYLNQLIPRKSEPQLHKIGDDYWIRYNVDNVIENEHFRVNKILIMMTTVVFIEAQGGNQRKIILDFQTLNIAQKMCQQFATQVNLATRRTYNLFQVLDLSTDPQIASVSQGTLCIDPFPTNSFCKFTIVQSNQPRFVFHSNDFQVSQVTNGCHMTLTINMDGEEYNYLLKFSTSNEAKSFYDVVTTENHVS